MWHFLFGLRGRISRASFSLYAAVAFVGLLALMSALYAYELLEGGYETGESAPWPSTPLGITGATLWFAMLGVLVVSALCVTLKRLHDRDKPAWWLLVFLVLPNALSSAGQFWRYRDPESADEIGAVLYLAALAFFGWAFIDLLCLRGTEGENRFGPDPLRR